MARWWGGWSEKNIKLRQSSLDSSGCVLRHKTSTTPCTNLLTSPTLKPLMIWIIRNFWFTPKVFICLMCVSITTKCAQMVSPNQIHAPDTPHTHTRTVNVIIVIIIHAFSVRRTFPLNFKFGFLSFAYASACVCVCRCVSIFGADTMHSRKRTYACTQKHFIIWSKPTERVEKFFCVLFFVRYRNSNFNRQHGIRHRQREKIAREFRLKNDGRTPIIR